MVWIERKLCPNFCPGKQLEYLSIKQNLLNWETGRNSYVQLLPRPGLSELKSTSPYSIWLLSISVFISSYCALPTRCSQHPQPPSPPLSSPLRSSLCLYPSLHRPKFQLNFKFKSHLNFNSPWHSLFHLYVSPYRPPSYLCYSSHLLSASPGHTCKLPKGWEFCFVLSIFPMHRTTPSTL